MSKRTDWVIGHDATKGDMAYALECKRCGKIQKVAVPIEVGCYVAMGRAFLKMHRKCKLRKQMEGE